MTQAGTDPASSPGATPKTRREAREVPIAERRKWARVLARLGVQTSDPFREPKLKRRKGPRPPLRLWERRR